MKVDLDWEQILLSVIGEVESGLHLSLVIDSDIVREIREQARKTLASFGKDKPNLAKIAGSVAFWIRQLKPISHDDDCENKFLAINELVALETGLAICALYARFDINRVSKRVLLDWATSLRLNAHSPHGIVMAFEILVSDLTH